MASHYFDPNTPDRRMAHPEGLPPPQNLFPFEEQVDLTWVDPTRMAAFAGTTLGFKVFYENTAADTRTLEEAAQITNQAIVTNSSYIQIRNEGTGLSLDGTPTTIAEIIDDRINIGTGVEIIFGALTVLSAISLVAVTGHTLHKMAKAVGGWKQVMPLLLKK